MPAPIRSTPSIACDDLPNRYDGWRAAAFPVVVALAAVGLVGRAAQVQIAQHATWDARANSQMLRHLEVPANRGTIRDRAGAPLAVTADRYEFAVAPQEARDLRLLRDTLVSAGVPSAAAARILDTDRRWVVLPGRYTPEQRAALRGFRGVYFTHVTLREYPHTETLTPLLGRLGNDGRPAGGIEAANDTLLRGLIGHRTAYRDAAGRMREPIDAVQQEPRPGADLDLTLDGALQEAGTAVLREAVDSAAAEGGDLVVVDVHTGALLAATGYSKTRGATLTYMTDPYEPGSVVKPFIYAGLLEAGKASLDDSVFAENGHYALNGRTIEDTHPYGTISLRQALAVSSNIVTAKVAGRLTPDEEYGYLFRFGFGQKSTLGIRGEAAGRLPRPKRWSKMSSASIAMGYEMAATPLQLAYAYATLANGGLRMRATVVSGVRSANGALRVLPASPAERAISPLAASKILGALEDVVKEGTGKSADMGAFRVAGKTGTARAFDGHGYSGYYASFGGVFPAENPQVAFLVRITRPSRGGYYGGTWAAPVARRLLESMLAVENPPVDRKALAQGITTEVRGAPLAHSPSARRWRDLRITAVAAPHVKTAGGR